MNTGDFFRRFGRECRYVTPAGGERRMYAFISPLRYKNKMYLYGVNTEIGYNPEGYYLYIGPASPAVSADDDGYIECGGESYRLDRAEKVYRGAEIFYIWAILRKITEADYGE